MSAYAHSVTGETMSENTGAAQPNRDLIEKRSLDAIVTTPPASAGTLNMSSPLPEGEDLDA